MIKIKWSKTTQTNFEAFIAFLGLLACVWLMIKIVETLSKG